MANTLSVVFVMHQWECILKLINQYQIPCAKQVAWTFSLTNQLEWWWFFSFPAVGRKLHYKAPPRQLSQGCTIFIDSYCVIYKNYVRLCGNLQIMRLDAIFDQLCRITPSHFIRGPVRIVRNGYYLHSLCDSVKFTYCKMKAIIAFT